MSKCEEQDTYAAQTNQDGQPIYLFDQMITGNSFFDGIFAVLHGENESNTTFGTRGVAGSNDFSSFQSGTSVVAGVKVALVKPIGSWSSPSGKLALINQNGKRVLGHKVTRFEPTHLDSPEGVVNFNSLCCVDDFWMDNKDPKNGSKCEAVYKRDESLLNHSYREVRTGRKAADQNNQNEVSPIASWAVNVIVRHDGQTTADASKVSLNSVTMEGI